MNDGFGFIQFVNAVTEMAQGACAPSIPPVWQREILNARNPPQVTCTHHEFDKVVYSNVLINPIHHMTCRSFFFGSTQLSAIRRNIPHHLRKSSTFEVLTAYLWRCRTIALQLNPEDEVRLLFAINVRNKFCPPFPKGYYGNGIAPALALTTSGKLCQNPLKYALELIKTAKANVTEEYFRSLIDLLVIKGQPSINMVQSYYVSDIRHLGFADLDFGWGKPAFGGPFKFFEEPGREPTSYYISVKNNQGENGIIVPMWLPTSTIERFVKELHSILGDHAERSPTFKLIISSL